MKSETPRTDALAEQMLADGDSPRVTTIRLVFHACQLERELIAAQSRICELESANAKSTTAMPNSISVEVSRSSS